MRSPDVMKSAELPPSDVHDENGAACPPPPADEPDPSPMEALRRYYPAVLWSAGISCVSVMEGYNIGLGGSMIILHPCERKYGTYDPKLGHYIVNYQWQIGLSMAATLGGIIGALLGGFLIERFGARITIMVAQVYVAGAIFMTFFAPTMPVMFASIIINGVGWGALAQVGPVYSSEVCPTSLRGYLIDFTNIAWVIGGLIAAIVLQPESTNQSQWAFKLPFALQWIWPVPLFLVALLAPDSPWWLLRHDRVSDAEKTLQRLTNDPNDAEIKSRISQMIRTNEYEIANKTVSSYRDCFRGANLRRTEIAVVALCSQSTTGQGLLANPSYFLHQVGFNNSQTFKLTVGSIAFGLVANFLCWFLMSRFGRRPLFLIGSAGSTIILLLIGVLTSVHNHSALLTQGALCIAWVLPYQGFVTPDAYTIAGEISATRVRSETLAIARSVFGLVATLINVVQSSLINPTGVNIGGYTSFLWFGLSFLTFMWAWYRLPESRGLSYEELDHMFDNRVSARQFKHHRPVVTDGIIITEDAGSVTHVNVGKAHIVEI